MVLPALMAPMLRKAATEWKFASGNQFTAPAAASTVPAAVLAGGIAPSRAMRSFSLILVFMVFGFQDEGGETGAVTAPGFSCISADQRAPSSTNGDSLFALLAGVIGVRILLSPSMRNVVRKAVASASKYKCIDVAVSMPAALVMVW